MNNLTAPPPQRILVIDDSLAIHEDFRKIFAADPRADDLDAAEAALFGGAPATFKPPRFTIDSAYQGQEGLARVEAAVAAGQAYAMAFVDVRMPPGWDGVETVARMWQVDPDLQVVLCTAYSDYSWDEMIAKVGMSDRLVILKKPFDNIEVVQLASVLTEKWHLLQEAKRRIEDLEELVAERAAELHKTEERFRLIAENAADLIAIWDTNGQRLYSSPSHEKVLGIPLAQLDSTPPAAQIHPDDHIKVVFATQAAVATGASQVLEYRMQDCAGAWRVLEAHANPVRNAAGAVKHLVMVARDITERTREDEERRQMEVQLRHAQKQSATSRPELRREL